MRVLRSARYELIVPNSSLNLRGYTTHSAKLQVVGLLLWLGPRATLTVRDAEPILTRRAAFAPDTETKTPRALVYMYIYA